MNKVCRSKKRESITSNYYYYFFRIANSNEDIHTPEDVSRCNGADWQFQGNELLNSQLLYKLFPKTDLPDNSLSAGSPFPNFLSQLPVSHFTIRERISHLPIVHPCIPILRILLLFISSRCKHLWSILHSTMKREILRLQSFCKKLLLSGKAKARPHVTSFLFLFFFSLFSPL